MNSSVTMYPNRPAERLAQGNDVRVTLMSGNDGGLSSKRDGDARCERKCALDTGARGWRWVVRAH